ncbi:hypothetical protein CDL62_14580 [Alkalitalea saponilacus]|uniref:hypothetical protein n=1 Tax=Alkalitalea saponilacus TaxID=889453 RepID=UPI000B4BB1F1|nr:hypothetical protein [Alkalitalea saponilacus]ASB50275.1 hypothetical protein CDL62_14580 [Alkalitalea saponilacus]
MNNPSPKHLLKGTLYLDVLNLEEKTDQYFNESLFHENNEVFIDLSQTRFVQLNAIAQLLLLIESLHYCPIKI